MTIFSICTAYIENGKIEKTIEEFAESEKKFTRDIGVIFRKFFQCTIQPHIIWAFTEWDSEKDHNNAAQSIMQTRRDDRFASIAFGPEPYFEIFCEEEENFNVGRYSDDFEIFIVVRGLINEKLREKYLDLRKVRINNEKNNLEYLRIYRNTYNSCEFIALLGFTNEDEFYKKRNVGDLFLEEYLFTGLKNPLGMSYIANYNQFICKSIKI